MFKEMQRREAWGLGVDASKKVLCEGRHPEWPLTPSEPRPVLDGVIWGDRSQHLPFFKTKPASCSSKIITLVYKQ